MSGKMVFVFSASAGHGPFRDLDPEFEPFPVDSRTSPGCVRIGHFADEIADFFACSWPTESVTF